MTWDVPTAEDCPECGQTLFKKSGKGRMKPFCINEKCPRFLPEDQRGYYRKKTTEEAPQEPGEPAGAAPEAAPKKTAVKKTAAKKTTAAQKTVAAKKTTAAKKTAAKTPKKTREEQS